MNSGGIILSVIIPCYNDGKFLPNAVRSAQQNHHGRHEIIVVNDGSTESHTLQVLEELRNAGVWVIDQENAGLGAARNRGIAAARGRYILPLDSDNRIRPEYIDRGIAILDDEPEVDVIYGDAEYFGEKAGRWYVRDFSLHLLLQFNYIDACAVYRKSAWERCGGYDRNMPTQGHEDWDFWIRVACSGGKFCHVKEVLFDYQIRANSMTTGMIKPALLNSTRQYIYDKQFMISIGEYFRLHRSWDFVTEVFRRNPLRCTLNLLMRAYCPVFRAWLLGLFRKRTP